MTREEYVALPRQWIGTVRYPLSDESIRVALIARYSPGCVELALYRAKPDQPNSGEAA